MNTTTYAGGVSCLLDSESFRRFANAAARFRSMRRFASGESVVVDDAGAAGGRGGATGSAAAISSSQRRAASSSSASKAAAAAWSWRFRSAAASSCRQRWSARSAALASRFQRFCAVSSLNDGAFRPTLPTPQPKRRFGGQAICWRRRFCDGNADRLMAGRNYTRTSTSMRTRGRLEQVCDSAQRGQCLDSAIIQSNRSSAANIRRSGDLFDPNCDLALLSLPAPAARSLAC
ncbi:unnamed protein product [Pelagomonas calceolata]|uniref:Uncharacterized protein n=1 Tax=Pelagomonas calceolata TaxID=35677 RepID=A0A8J2X197_9STRA|nr:unnamed protein product [Pelagomonas calceolata]